MAEAVVPVAASVMMGGMHMGRENDLMLDYLRDNRRFADLFNGGLFAGAQVVNACDLEEAGENYTDYRQDADESSAGYPHDIREDAPRANPPLADTPDTVGVKTAKTHRKAKEDFVTARSRDIKKRLKSGTELRILAVEDQSYVDYTMPWRCLNYDSLEYGRQVKEIQKKNESEQKYADSSEKLCRFTREDKLMPVYTLCLYHGTEHWDGPKSLRDMIALDCNKESPLWEKYFSDYQMNLICVNELKNFSEFSTGLRELFRLMTYRKDKQGMRDFLANHEEYQHLDEETARVISGMMGVETFMDDKERYEKGGQYNMCQAIREMWEDGWNDGLSQGISQGINQGIEQGIAQGVERGVSLSASIFRAIRSGISANQEIAERCGCTEEEVENIRKAFDI